jgi:hypothetical protein
MNESAGMVLKIEENGLTRAQILQLPSTMGIPSSFLLSGPLVFKATVAAPQ